MEETIVQEWLRSLNLECYAESFIDNGYDDLEICKQIDAPDLDAIGVVDISHRNSILEAVQVLRVEGAASVYFTVEEAQAATQETLSRNSDPGPNFEKTRKSGTGSSASTPGDATHHHFLDITCGDIDAYEAGRAELVRLPQLQLRKLIQESLVKDNVNLTLHPYTTKEGERGALDGLASRYADQFNTHFQDVLEHLEHLRSQEYNKILASGSPKFVIAPSNNHVYQQRPDQLEQRTEVWSPRSSSSSSLEHNGDDYPIYLPGKYNPSSCLSDAEEDQIYGFTEGSHATVPASGPGFLNPRSQCIYELPPTRVRHGSQNGMKKKLGLGRLLKTLKRDLKRSSDTKHKNYPCQSVTANTRQLCGVPTDLSSTPLVVLPGYSSPTSSHCSQSSKSQSSGQSYIVTSASAPGTPGSSGPVRDSGLQHEIERLKEQEIKRRREEQFREHEQILQDIRQGLQQIRGDVKGVCSTYIPYTNHINNIGESSYMFDDENISTVRASQRSTDGSHHGPHLFQHWYDEPPYESDPEDFLIGKDNIRGFLACQNRLSRDEDVISLKTAGDISLPRDSVGGQFSDCSPRHCYLPYATQPVVVSRNSDIPYNTVHKLPNRNYLNMETRPKSLIRGDDVVKMLLENPTVDQSSSHANQLTPEALSYAEQRLGSCQELPHDVQSISSRLSNISVDTTRSETVQHVTTSRLMNRSSGSDEAHSCSPSDFEEDSERINPESLVGRMRVLQRDMQKKIGHLKNNSRGGQSVDSSATAAGLKNEESLRERLRANYSYYQRQNSLPVKLRQVYPLDARGHCNGRDQNNRLVANPFIGRARALVDFEPFPYDKEALKFKKGDIIDVVSKCPSGLWRGHLNGKFGFFKFILVEELPDQRLLERSARRYGMTYERQIPNVWIPKPSSIRELLVKFNMTHISQIILLNGIEDLEQFRDLCREDLDQMGITDHDTRSKILAAIGFLLDLEEFEEASEHWMENSTFVRHTNGRVSLPAGGTNALPFNPLAGTGHQQGIRQGSLMECYQIYENTSYLGQPPDENNLDHSIHSSSSTDTSSGYHSRPTFNIPLAATQHTSPDPPLSPTVPTLAQKPISPLTSNACSHSSTTSPPCETGNKDALKEKIPTDSYHAHVALVQSSPSLIDGEEILSLESTSC